MTTQLITRVYQGNTFHFRGDGYFNMTKAARTFGKDVREFMKAQGNQDYIQELLNAGISPQLAKRGRYGGTWGHPKLAVFFARWLDTKFAVWCDRTIDDLIHGNAQLTITNPEKSAVMALPEDFSSAMRLAAELILVQKYLGVYVYGASAKTPRVPLPN